MSENDYKKFIFSETGLDANLISDSHAELFQQLFNTYHTVMRSGGQIWPLQRIGLRKRSYLNKYEFIMAQSIVKKIAMSCSGVNQDPMFIPQTEKWISETVFNIVSLGVDVEPESVNELLFRLRTLNIVGYWGKYGKLGNMVKEAYTHSGSFHADDVCCAALLKILFPNIEIVRVPQVPKNADLAFDIGWGVFDHHQPDAKVRPDGVKYSSFGLLWSILAPYIFEDPWVYNSFDMCFVREIDYVDNYGGMNPLTSTIRAFNPLWDSFSSGNTEFEEAVEFAKETIIRHFMRMNASIRAAKFVKDRIEDGSRPTKNSLVLEVYSPFERVCSENNIKYVIYPSNRDYGMYNLSVVRGKEGGDDRILLPKEWVEKKPFGCTYISINRNFAVFTKKEFALGALKILDK